MTDYMTHAVIFDLDGTLIDSMRSFNDIVHFNLKKRGIKISSDNIEEVGHQLLTKYQDPPSKTGFRLVFSIFWKIGRTTGLNYFQNFLFSFQCILEVKEVYTKASLFPKVKECLSKLLSNGFCLGICTTASRKQLEKILEKYEITQFFCQDALITRDDVTRVKPDPEGLLLAIKACSAIPQHSYFLGDLPSDIVAGNQAKITSIGLTTGLLKKSLLTQYSTPSAIFDSLEEATTWILESRNTYR
jgi:phosphoglycolate phosphatase-like HAD superfamily hydrolase